MTFLEGIAAFISPCTLPMLPVYVSYFAGETRSRKNALLRSLCFVAGFTAVFCLMGVCAGTVGRFLLKNRQWVNIVCGVLIILFGLAYLEIIPLRFLKGMRSAVRVNSAWTAFLFGIVFSVSLTPCVGPLLGAALSQAAAAGTAWRGCMLLFVYSLGMGIPFVVSAVLLEKLRGVFAFVKRHYAVVNTVCGILLIAAGVLMLLGIL